MPTPDHQEPGQENTEELKRLNRELDAAEHRIETHDDDARLRIPEILTKPTPGARKLSADARRESEKDFTGIGQAWSVAFEFIFTIVAGGGAGYLFDRWRGSSPVGTLVGLAAGFVLAFVRIVRTTQAQERRDKQRRDEQKKHAKGS